MAAPIWITKAGDLGVISELEFYTLNLDAYDPDAGSLTFGLVSGHLPRGMSLTNRGTIQGIPLRGRLDFSGVPYNVDRNTTNNFTVRATSTQNIVTDRSFSVTVTGARAPEILTPGPGLGYYYDGVY